MKSRIGVGVIGFGTVGTGVAKLLLEDRKHLLTPEDQAELCRIEDEYNKDHEPPLVITQAHVNGPTGVGCYAGWCQFYMTAYGDVTPCDFTPLSFGNAMSSMSDFLFSGVLVDFPRLQLAYSEGQMGWVPYILERADDVWEEHRAWGGVRDRIPEPPSTYYYDHVFCCFFRDRHGLRSLDEVGVDNVTFETDYPHTDTSWPDTVEVVKQMLEGQPDDIVYRVVRGNAIRMLGLDRV